MFNCLSTSYSILVTLTNGDLQFPDSEDEVHNEDDSSDDSDDPKGDASLIKMLTMFANLKMSGYLRVLVVVPLAVPTRVEVDSQGPGGDHQHGANKGRHHLNPEIKCENL